MERPSPRRIVGTRGAILIVILGAMLFSSVYPLNRYFSVRNEITALQGEERELDERAKALEAAREKLLTDAEIERLARERLGYVRPGEIPFAIVPPPEKADEPPIITPEGEPPPADGTSGVFERWWDAMRRAVSAS